MHPRMKENNHSAPCSSKCGTLLNNILHPGGVLAIIAAIIGFASCQVEESAGEILNKAIQSIDTVQTITFKQDMTRSDPTHPEKQLFRYREMVFTRLPGDSIVGVKGHWYMYVDDREHPTYEDIYDGDRLVRKNNRDSLITVYDLAKYPAFKNTRFWGHNTFFAMQFALRNVLGNPDLFLIARLEDTVYRGTRCYQVLIVLENKTTQPGFSAVLEDSPGSVSETRFLIDKTNYFPVRMRNDYFQGDYPGQAFFIDQTYYDILFNRDIDAALYFNTSLEKFSGYVVREKKP